MKWTPSYVRNIFDDVIFSYWLPLNGNLLRSDFLAICCIMFADYKNNVATVYNWLLKFTSYVTLLCPWSEPCSCQVLHQLLKGVHNIGKGKNILCTDLHTTQMVSLWETSLEIFLLEMQ